jgi:hypothetical protein
MRRSASNARVYLAVDQERHAADQVRADEIAETTAGTTPINKNAGRKQVINGRTLRTPTDLAAT